MTTLLLRLAGPMQSWGTRSRFTERDTGREPSKSGVIGLLAAALGIPRPPEPPPPDAPTIEALAALRMHVRVDAEGNVAHDFQTAGGGDFRGRHYGVYKASGAKGDTVISNRYYLADADFLVALESGDRALLETLVDALRAPRWPLYLGRRSYVPTSPILAPHPDQADTPLIDEPAEAVLRRYPWSPPLRRQEPDSLRLVLECRPDQGEIRMDQPVSFQSDDRAYHPRHVRMDYVDTADLPRKEETACISPD